MSNPSGAQSRWTPILLAVILAGAAGVRFWALGFGLPHTQARPDETHIIDVTLAFLKGNFRPYFYDYPWLYMWVLTGSYLLYYVWGAATASFQSVADLVASWPVHWAPFFLISRSISAIAGTATVFAVYRLGRRLWDDTTGLIAALFLALAFLHVRDSHFGTTDVAMTLLAVWSVSALIAAHDTGRRSWFVLAGLAGGLATATKYSAVFLVVPFLVSLAVHVSARPDRRWRAIFDRRAVWFALPFAGAFAIGVPFVVLDWSRFWPVMQWLADSMIHGPGHAPHVESGWIYHVKFSLRYGLGLPLLLTAVAGTAALIVRQPRIGVLLMSFPIAYYVIAGAMGNRFFRYMIPTVPFLCLAAGWLVVTSVRRLTRLDVVAALASIAIAAPSAVSIWEFNRIMAQTDSRVLVTTWFAEHAPAGQSIAQSGSRYGHAQIDARKWAVWTWDGGRNAFMHNRQRVVDKPDWIVVQDSPLPSMTQEVIQDYLRDGYAPVQQITAFTWDRPHVYDLQDAFFVPFAGFEGIRRPGPNFLIYKKTTAPPLASDR